MNNISKQDGNKAILALASLAITEAIFDKHLQGVFAPINMTTPVAIGICVAVLLVAAFAINRKQSSRPKQLMTVGNEDSKADGHGLTRLDPKV
jgi:hypothetical protein